MMMMMMRSPAAYVTHLVEASPESISLSCQQQLLSN